MNKNDRRYIKTDRLIKQVFLKLLDTKGYDNITILDICQMAMISRSTFYQHFIDKNDVLNSIYSDLIDNITTMQNEQLEHQAGPDSVKHGLNWYIDIINKNHDIFRILLKAPAENLINILHRYIFDAPVRLVIPDYDILSPDIYTQLDETYLFSAMISFTAFWLDHYDELSVEDVRKELMKLSCEPIRVYTERLFAGCDAGRKN